MQPVSQVRAKFVAGTVTTGADGTVAVSMYPVCASDDHPENRSFAEASPDGHFRISIAPGKPAGEFFKQGASYYLDITEVPVNRLAVGTLADGVTKAAVLTSDAPAGSTAVVESPLGPVAGTTGVDTDPATADVAPGVQLNAGAAAAHQGEDEGV